MAAFRLPSTHVGSGLFVNCLLVQEHEAEGSLIWHCVAVDWSAEGSALYDVGGIDKPLRTAAAQAALEQQAHRAGEPTFTLHQCLEVRRPLTASLAAHAWQVAAHFCPASCASLCMASLPLLGQVLGAAGLSWQHTRLSAALLVRQGACAA